MFAVAAVLALLYGSAAGYLYVRQDHFVLPQTINHIKPLTAADGVFENLSIPTPDGATLNGILFTPAAPSPTLILAFGGNAHDVVGMAAFLKRDVFPTANIAVAGLSYRGYPNALGRPSTGKPSQASLYADSELIYDTLVARLKPARIYAVGYSLGTAVSTYLATARNLTGLVLIAPPASVRRLAQEEYPWLPVAPLLHNPFATEDMLARVTVPTTLIYTPTDGLIPPTHVTGILHAAMPSATLVPLLGTDHGNILFHPQLPAYLRRLIH